MEASLVLFIKAYAVAELLDDLSRRLCPDSLGAAVGDVRLAGCDHLVSDLKRIQGLFNSFEPCYEKTKFLHMRKQRRRSAAQ